MEERKQKKRKNSKPRYRSGFEKDVATSLTHQNIPFRYEPYAIKYLVPEANSSYLPDFLLPNGIIIETKGRFLSKDRKKHLLIQKQYPSLDIRFVFQSPSNKLYKGSKSTYIDWCHKHNFKWAKKRIPLEWLEEPSKVKK